MRAEAGNKDEASALIVCVFLYTLYCSDFNGCIIIIRYLCAEKCDVPKVHCNSYKDIG